MHRFSKNIITVAWLLIAGIIGMELVQHSACCYEPDVHEQTHTSNTGPESENVEELLKDEFIPSGGEGSIEPHDRISTDPSPRDMNKYFVANIPTPPPDIS